MAGASALLACTVSLAAQTVTDRAWWLSGQLNVIYQWHPSFPASYSGANSLRSTEESARSSVATVYGGLRVGSKTEILFDLESAGGGGISQAFGLAGFTNLDVVRNPTLGPSPYVARGLIRYSIPLSGVKQSHTPARIHDRGRGGIPRPRMGRAVGRGANADRRERHTIRLGRGSSTRRERRDRAGPWHRARPRWDPATPRLHESRPHGKLPGGAGRLRRRTGLRT